MQLTLTDRETELLLGLLEAHLPELQREVARTEAHTLRHELVERLNLVEQLLTQLAPRVARP